MRRRDENWIDGWLDGWMRDGWMEGVRELELLTEVVCISELKGVTAVDVVIEGLLNQVLGLIASQF